MEIQSPFKISDQNLQRTHFATFILESIKRHGAQTALVDSKTEWSCTFDDIPRCVALFCDYFQRHDLFSDRRVALISLNCPEFCFAQLAASVLGVDLIHASPLGTVEELSTSLTISKCDAILTQPEFLPKLQRVSKSVPSCENVLLLPDQNSLLTTTQKNWPALSHRFNRMTFFSSGTTGPPKAFQVPTETFPVCFRQLSVAPFNPPRRENGEDLEANKERTLIVCPLTHVYAVSSMFYAIYSGHLVVTTPRFMPDIFLELLEKYKITYIHVVPPIVSFLANDAPIEKYDLSHFHSITSAAAPLSLITAVKCKEKLRLKDMRQLYGMTEIRHCIWTPYGHDNFLSIGLLIPGTGAKFVDPDNQQVINAPYQQGELWIMGPQTGGTYFENEKATKETFVTEDGVTWCKTGDIGYYDEKGYIYLTDRYKDLIKYKGLQVSPSEIESILHQSPDVIDCAVVGKPDQTAGEVPVAFVVRKQGSSISAESLKKLVKDRLSSYKQLSNVIFLQELPRTATGKLQKRHLRKLLTEPNSKL